MTPERLNEIDAKLQRLYDVSRMSSLFVLDQQELITLAYELASDARKPKEPGTDEAAALSHLQESKVILDQAEELVEAAMESAKGSVKASEIVRDLDYPIASLLDHESSPLDRIVNAVAILVRLQCLLAELSRDTKDEARDTEDEAEDQE